VAKLESFGAFCRLPGLRKQGLLHISQISNTRVEAEDLPHILAVDDAVFVKVISVDEASGKISLSMKLASQGDGRDLDPSHAEAQAEGERGGGRGRRVDPDTIREQKKNLAAMQVPEYGGKQRGGSEYALVPDVDDEAPSRAPAASGDGKYRLQMPGGGPPPPPPPPPPPSGRAPGAPGLSRQVELAAQLLAQAEARKERKRDKKEKKEEKKEKKRKHSSSGKKEKHKDKKHKKHEKKEKKEKKEKRLHLVSELEQRTV
jgi:predicted RNA-binding protein with RPS1 domain